MCIRKKVLGVGAESTTLLIQDNEANRELRVMRRVNVAKWKRDEVASALEFYCTLMQHKLKYFVPIYAVTHNGNYLNITTAYCNNGDLNSYLEDVCDKSLNMEQILRWGVFIASAIHELNSQTQLHFYGLELDRIFMLGNDEIRAGLPVLPTEYWTLLHNRQRDGVAVERQYPMETLSSEVYYGELTDVWHLGHVMQTLLSVHCQYSSRPPSVRELVAEMMNINYTKRPPITEVIAQMQQMLVKSNNRTNEKSSEHALLPTHSSRPITTEASGNYSNDNNNNNYNNNNDGNISSRSNKRSNISSDNNNKTEERQRTRSSERRNNMQGENDNLANKESVKDKFLRLNSNPHRMPKELKQLPSTSQKTTPCKVGEPLIRINNSNKYKEPEIINLHNVDKNRNNTNCVYATKIPSARRAVNQINNTNTNIGSDNKDDESNNNSNSSEMPKAHERHDRHFHHEAFGDNWEEHVLQELEEVQRLNVSTPVPQHRTRNGQTISRHPTPTAKLVQISPCISSSSHNSASNINNSNNNNFERINSKLSNGNKANKEIKNRNREYDKPWRLPSNERNESKEGQRLERKHSLTPTHDVKHREMEENHSERLYDKESLASNETEWRRLREMHEERIAKHIKIQKEEMRQRCMQRQQEQQEKEQDCNSEIIKCKSYNNDDVEQMRVNKHKKEPMECIMERKSQADITNDDNNNNSTAPIITNTTTTAAAAAVAVDNHSDNNNNNNITSLQHRSDQHCEQRSRKESLHHSEHYAINHTNSNAKQEVAKEAHYEAHHDERAKRIKRNENIPVTVMLPPHTRANVSDTATRAEQPTRNNKDNSNNYNNNNDNNMGNTREKNTDVTSTKLSNKENERPLPARTNALFPNNTSQPKFYNNDANRRKKSNNDNKNDNDNFDKNKNTEQNNEEKSVSESDNKANANAEMQNKTNTKQKVNYLNNNRAAPVISNRSRLKAGTDQNYVITNKNSALRLENGKDEKAEKAGIISNDNNNSGINKNNVVSTDEALSKTKNNNNNNNNKNNTNITKEMVLHTTTPLPQQINKRDAVWHVSSNPIVKQGKINAPVKSDNECRNVAFASPNTLALPFGRSKSGMKQLEEPESHPQQPPPQHARRASASANEDGSINHGPSSESSSITTGNEEIHKQTITALASLEWTVDGLRSSIRGLLHDRELYGNVLATINGFLDENEEVRSSAHANRQFMNNIHRVIADEHIYCAAAPLCAQLVALEGASKSIRELQESERSKQRLHSA